MVTYSDLFLFGTFVVSVIELMMNVKRSDRRDPDKFGDHSKHITGLAMSDTMPLSLF